MKHNSRPILLWLNQVAGKAKLNIIMLLAVQALLGISSVGYAMFLRKIVNAAVAGNRSSFFLALGLFAGLIIVQILLRAISRYLVEYTRSSLENRFKSRLFKCLLTGDFASVTRTHSGEWMNRLTSDTLVVADGLTDILPGVAGMAIKMAGAVVAILWLDARFLYILVPGGIALIVIATAFRRIMKRMHKTIQEKDGKVRVFLSERLSSLLIIRAFAQEKQMSKMAEALMEEHRSARMHRNHLSNFCNSAYGLAMNGLYVMGAGFCGYGILTGTMSYGNLTAILQLIAQIQNPVANITGYLPKYYAMIASAERLSDAEKFTGEPEAKVLIDFDAIGLQEASFTYLPPTEDNKTLMPVILENVTLEIQKGEYVAFTGPSGCGKSTVLKLLMSFYPLDSGLRYVRIDGQKFLMSASHRSLFAYVPQGNQLLAGTIREIITFGNTEDMQKEEHIQHALKIACAEDFVRELEHGIDTPLGERGAGLSEGQMQRLAIARAVYSDRPILLLDEATSALDEKTEAQLLDNLHRMTEKTVVIITHRPAALEICDRQIQIDKLAGDYI